MKHHPLETKRRSLPQGFASVAFVACCLGSSLTALGQSSSLEPSPLVLEGYRPAPRKLQVQQASSLLSRPVSPLTGQPASPQLYASTPEQPSIINEMVSMQEDMPLEGAAPQEGLVEPAPAQEDSMYGDYPDTQGEPKLRPSKPWQLKSITSIDFVPAEDPDQNPNEPKILPEDRSEAILSQAQQGGPTLVNDTAYWVAPNLYYQPLLFEDPLLERYGRSAHIWGVQPVLSGLHFTVDSALMPFRAIKYRCEWETPLAFERPGSCTQQTREIHFPHN